MAPDTTSTIPTKPAYASKKVAFTTAGVIGTGTAAYLTPAILAATANNPMLGLLLASLVNLAPSALAAVANWMEQRTDNTRTSAKAQEILAEVEKIKALTEQARQAAERFRESRNATIGTIKPKETNIDSSTPQPV